MIFFPFFPNPFFVFLIICEMNLCHGLFFGWIENPSTTPPLTRILHDISVGDHMAFILLYLITNN